MRAPRVEDGLAPGRVDGSARGRQHSAIRREFENLRRRTPSQTPIGVFAMNGDGRSFESGFSVRPPKPPRRSSPAGSRSLVAVGGRAARRRIRQRRLRAYTNRNFSQKHPSLIGGVRCMQNSPVTSTYEADSRLPYKPSRESSLSVARQAAHVVSVTVDG